MKVFISVDMEGISGLVRWPDVSSHGIDFKRNRRLMTLDANAAVAGAFAGGATEVVVEENHGVEDVCVLLMDEVDARCRVIRGAGRGGSTTMAGLKSDCAVVLLIGHHARAGSRPGIMAHTISWEGFRLVSLHGQPIGEPDFFAIRAGELGVPVGMVSGDQVVAEQVRELSPLAECVIVKHALSNQAADCLAPARARELIAAGAERAVRAARNGTFKPYRAVATPYVFDVALKSPMNDAMRSNLNALKDFEIVSEGLVRVTAPDMDLGFRRVAYLGYANRPGVLKY